MLFSTTKNVISLQWNNYKISSGYIEYIGKYNKRAFFTVSLGDDFFFYFIMSYWTVHHSEFVRCDRIRTKSMLSQSK